MADGINKPERAPMTAVSGTGASYHGTSVLPKACENCRIRKIRCNKTVPCSNCQIANLPCRSSLKPTESSKLRPSPIPYQEKNFNLIHESLSDIKKALGRLEHNAVSLSPSTLAESESASASPYTPVKVFEGDLSFIRHSEHATLSAEISAAAPENIQTAEVALSLSSLKSLLDGRNLPSRINELRFPNTSPHISSAKVELPPVSLVIAVLKRANKRTPISYLQLLFTDCSVLENLCKDIYFPTKPIPPEKFNLMNGLLMFLLFEYSMDDEDPTTPVSDCKEVLKLCERNFLNAMLTYEAMVTPSLENIQCLMIAAMKAQEDARPALCWTLLSAGARLCLLLGYHRKDVLDSDTPELADRKRRAFWMIYMMDKIFSLSLGRVSNFPDYDIDAVIFTASKIREHRPWDIVYIGTIRLGQILGQVYDEVYSTKARRKSPEMKSRTIEDLSSTLSHWHHEFKKIDSDVAIGKEDIDLIVDASDFIYYSCLTQLYEAESSHAGPTQISSRHFDAARKCLQCHVANGKLWPQGEVIRCKFYCDWVILYFSFTPFLVVFTHCIASHSQEDVELLSQALDALAPVRNLSESGDHLYQVCSVFLRVAKAVNQSQQLSFGNFDSINNSFTFPASSDNPVGSSQAPENLGFPFPFHDAGLGFRNSDVQQMSQFLDTFLVEQQTEDGLWNI